MLAPPRSVSFAHSSSSSSSSSGGSRQPRGGYLTTTTRTTTTTTTTTTVRRLVPRSVTASALLRSRAAPPTAPVDSGARFVQRMLEEPLLAEFYTNIWADAAAATTAERKSKNKRRAVRRRAAGPLVDIAQVAHVVTTLTDYRADYEPLPRMGAGPAPNIWTNGPDDDAVAAPDSASDDSGFIDVPIMSLHASRSPATVTTARFGALPRRISEVSEEGSVEEDGDAPLFSTVTKIVKAGATRSSDPLETSFADSDASEVTVTTSVAVPSLGERELQLQRSSAALVMRSDHLSQHQTTAAVASKAPSVDSAVPPPSNKNGSVVFSVVFMEEREWSWAVKFLLGLHEPIRHALFVMDRFLEQSYKQQQLATLESHVRQFFTWFKTYFVEYLRCQHDVKAMVLHPLLNLKYSTKLEVAKTYDEIDLFIAQIQRQERQLCSAAGVRDPATWFARLELLQTEIRRLNLTLHGVLNLEERTLHPALSVAFTEKTFHQYVMPRVFRSIKAKRVVVPWILDRSKVWGGEAEQQSIQSMLPFSAKLLYRKIWLPYFRNNVAGAMKNLNEFVDSPSAMLPTDRKAADGGGVCTIQ